MAIPSYEEMGETVSIHEYARGEPWDTGDYSHNMEVGFKDGETYFIKDDETGQGLVMPYVLADTVADEIGIDTEISYDGRAGKVIRPEIDGVPTDEYVPGFSGFFNKLAGRPLGPEPEEIYEASALKYFIADSDVAPNIVVNEEAAEPIDFQRAGSTAEHFYSEFLNDLEEIFDHLSRDFSREEFEEVVSGYAEEADLEKLERELRKGFETHDTFRNERREDSVIGKTLENFERFR